MRFIRIISPVRILTRNRIIRKSDKRDRIEIYPVFQLYEKTAGPFAHQRRMDSECHR